MCFWVQVEEDLPEPQQQQQVVAPFLGSQDDEKRNELLAPPQVIRSELSHNNQTTTFMKYFDRENERVLMLHDNRIYYFQIEEDEEEDDYEHGEHGEDNYYRKSIRGEPTSVVVKKDKRRKVIDYEERFIMYSNCLQNVLTTPKYRLIQLIYLIFKLADNISFLTLVGASIGGFVITDLDRRYLSVFTVVSVEIFYDVMNFTTRVWFLHRASLLIGLLLYIAYSVVFLMLDLELILWIVFIVRFASFVLEESTDYFLDCEIHNELAQKNRSFCCWKCKMYISNDLKDLEKTRKEYLGSISAWWITPAFVRYPKIVRKNKINPCSKTGLYGMIALLGLINIVTVLLAVLVYFSLSFCKNYGACTNGQCSCCYICQRYNGENECCCCCRRCSEERGEECGKKCCIPDCAPCCTVVCGDMCSACNDLSSENCFREAFYI